ncbi:hypothetical protein [Massilia genomosp. 1]|uniref:Uncharacterized protein n=1 Tax=Massilia genomosp. 1 TaxID=2609280 RepID=A0ABX0MTE5_9BURK|nr:hypothetical protein [Massilia genomosp. 1]NHZ66029.1 hypothetical protein [Massilia genomosp. 1]
MRTEVNDLGQMNVEITNVVATEDELKALRSGLARVYRKVDDLRVAPDGESKLGRRYKVCFVVPGPMVFQDECMNLLDSIGLVRWSISAQASPKRQPGDF